MDTKSTAGAISAVVVAVGLALAVGAGYLATPETPAGRECAIELAKAEVRLERLDKLDQAATACRIALAICNPE